MTLRYREKRKQHGIALIMVLLVVALVSIIAVGIATNQQLNTKRTENLLNNEQAYMYLLAAEYFAKDILIEDALNNSTDSFDDIWARETAPIPVDGGSVQGKIEDLQSFININSLIDGNGQINANQLAVLRNLINELSSQQPEIVIPNNYQQAIADWIDSDLDARAPDGAEDGEYLNKTLPYIAANQYFASKSELVLVNGFNFTNFSQLSPYITALPDTVSTINVNTADAMLISSLSNQISFDDANDIIKARPKKGYADNDTFLNLPEVKNKNVNPDLITMRSNYFLLTARAIIGNSTSNLYSLLWRESAGNNQYQVKVLLRSQRRI